ncbi:hypothetical protein LXL04_028784 [Taraxacum kok-saghyz]
MCGSLLAREGRSQGNRRRRNEASNLAAAKEEDSAVARLISILNVKPIYTIRKSFNAKFKDHFVCFGRSRTCMEQWYVHAHACMGMEASWSDSMGAKTVYGQLTPSGIEDRMVGEQVG